MKYFIKEKYSGLEGTVRISIDYNENKKIQQKHFPYIKSSYSILMARLLNLSYVDFLRFCRDELQGILVGKTGFTFPVFYEDNNKVDLLINILNKNLELAITEYKIQHKKRLINFSK